MKGLRPALINQSIAMANKFTGINIGSNEAFADNIYDIQKILDTINADNSKRGKWYKIGEVDRATKMLGDNIKALSKWENTPFLGRTVYTYANYYRKEIEIDNSELQRNGIYTILGSGRHIIICIGTNELVTECKEILKNRKKVNEGEVIDNSIYAYRGHKMLDGKQKWFLGAYGNNGLALLVDKSMHGKDIIDSIEKALIMGNLAIVDRFPTLFGRQNGCCLIDLDSLAVQMRKIG